MSYEHTPKGPLLESAELAVKAATSRPLGRPTYSVVCGGDLYAGEVVEPTYAGFKGRIAYCIFGWGLK